MRLAPLVLALLVSCNDRYRWAFAQELDGSVRAGEECRTTLADVIYKPTLKGRVVHERGNLYRFTGEAESYRIYGYREQAECEVALGAIVGSIR